MLSDTTTPTSSNSAATATASASAPAATIEEITREMRELEASVKSTGMLDFEAELNAALAGGLSSDDTASSASAPAPSATAGGLADVSRLLDMLGATADDEDDDAEYGDEYEVVEDDGFDAAGLAGDAVTADLFKDMETAGLLLGMLDGKCDDLNARLDQLLAAMEDQVPGEAEVREAAAAAGKVAAAASSTAGVPPTASTAPGKQGEAKAKAP
ncbi:hypothetical protein H9P43_007821 [Blastocladiella emersonii ATCC 22665]|nr:hypothetical protein H9P43_007821 [Blastocladiella emersonii ATCC 22665]